MSIKKKIPNILTGMRLVLIPVFAAVFFLVSPVWALGVFALACWTDLFDGMLARKWDAVSDFGKLADPVADKVMQITALVCLVIRGWLPLWCVILLAAKELVMVIGGGWALRKYSLVVHSNLLGKIASFVIDIAVGMTFLHDLFAPWDHIVLYLGLALTLAAMVNYGLGMIKQIHEKNTDIDSD